MRDEEWTTAERFGLVILGLGLAAVAGAVGAGVVMWFFLS